MSPSRCCQTATPMCPSHSICNGRECWKLTSKFSWRSVLYRPRTTLPSTLSHVTDGRWHSSWAVLMGPHGTSKFREEQIHLGCYLRQKYISVQSLYKLEYTEHGPIKSNIDAKTSHIIHQVFMIFLNNDYCSKIFSNFAIDFAGQRISFPL